MCIGPPINEQLIYPPCICICVELIFFFLFIPFTHLHPPLNRTFYPFLCNIPFLVSTSHQINSNEDIFISIMCIE